MLEGLEELVDSPDAPLKQDYVTYKSACDSHEKRKSLVPTLRAMFHFQQLPYFIEYVTLI